MHLLNRVRDRAPCGQREQIACLSSGAAVLGGLPQPALTVDMGPSTNVNSIHFAYDAGKPVAATGYFYVPETAVALPTPPTVTATVPEP